MRTSTRVSILAATAAVVALAVPASAAQQPSYLKGKSELEEFGATAAKPLRAQRAIRYTAPTAAVARWRGFQQELGGSWNALWDLDTTVPLRVYGSGIPAPGSVAVAAAAEAFARVYLERHLALLAPGAQLADFRVAANHLGDGMRTVSFFQHHRGMRVVGGQLSFRFKNDNLFVIASEALPQVASQAPGDQAIGAEIAGAAARGWIDKDFHTASVSGPVSTPMVLPLVREASGDSLDISFHTVVAVEVRTKQPIGRWRVYVNAATGVPVARAQLLHFASGTLAYDAPVRWPGGDRANYVAQFAKVNIKTETSEALATTDHAGAFDWSGTSSAELTASAEGSFVRAINAAGDPITGALNVAPGGQAVWSGASVEFDDAQITTFVHANIAKDWARIHNPQLPWLAAQLQATVNIGASCNAFSDGDTINFFRGSLACGNTGQIADVVYHEFGHSIHGQSIIPGAGTFDGALSEGAGDYLSATITGDPAVARGFFNDEEPLRHIDPDGKEHSWPDDVKEVHYTGLIISGALWDLRKQLITRYGAEEGIAQADRAFYAVLQRASDIPSAYIEVLAADDDDGNLANGTKNACDIAQHFGVHGLANPLDFGAGIGRPVRSGGQVSLAVNPPALACNLPQVTTATIDWWLRDDPATHFFIPMQLVGDTFAGDIPTAAIGKIVQYQIVLGLTDASTVTFPTNAAAPHYEFFVGEVTPLYCTDFETDPAAQGWTHGAEAVPMPDPADEPFEAVDEWQWAAPFGSGRDPGVAASGTHVFGTDIDGTSEGAYRPMNRTWALSPNVDIGAHTNIRLQYWRWLGVEDGHFDDARIYGDDQMLWSNLDSDKGNNSSTHHRDGEWMFHDVDLSTAAQDGSVQVKFELESDQGLELGGWTIDDFCVVAFEAPRSCPSGSQCAVTPPCAGASCRHPEPRVSLASEAAEDASGGCQTGSGGGLAFALLGLAAALGLSRRRRR